MIHLETGLSDNFCWEYNGTLYWNGIKQTPHHILEREELYQVNIPIDFTQPLHTMIIKGDACLGEYRIEDRNYVYTLFYIKPFTAEGHHYGVYLEDSQLTVLNYLKEYKIIV